MINLPVYILPVWIISAIKRHALLHNNLRKVVHTLVTKQYNLVLPCKNWMVIAGSGKGVIYHPSLSMSSLPVSTLWNGDELQIHVTEVRPRDGDWGSAMTLLITHHSLSCHFCKMVESGYQSWFVTKCVKSSEIIFRNIWQMAPPYAAHTVWFL